MLNRAKSVAVAVAKRAGGVITKPLTVYLSLTGAGLSLVATGLALIYPPAAFIVVGGALFTLGLLIDLDPKKPGGKP